MRFDQHIRDYRLFLKDRAFLAWWSHGEAIWYGRG
jgi:hypothetical protein